MKTILKAATAAIAIVGFVGGANAQSTHSSSSDTYSFGGIDTTVTSATPKVQKALAATYAFAQSKLGKALGLQKDSGSVYSQASDAPNNTEDADRRVANNFTLKGKVSADCSFYAGGEKNHTIDLGTIGVRTGNGDNVSIAFNQVSDAHASVSSATAGCNTENKVTIEKANGKKGLLNDDAGSFDSNQFTDRIPYSIKANWTGVSNSGGAQAGAPVELDVDSNEGQDSKNGGAWRSSFDMNVDIPHQNLGLVAGKYKDTITVTLAVL